MAREIARKSWMVGFGNFLLSLMLGSSIIGYIMAFVEVDKPRVSPPATLPHQLPAGNEDEQISKKTIRP